MDAGTHRWGVGLAAALAGLFLAAAAITRVGAGIALVPGDPILRALLEGRPVSSGDLARLAVSRRDALDWYGKGRTGADLGLALLLAAERRRILLTDRDLAPLEATLSDALAEAPAQPHAWLRLALALRLAGAPPEGVAKAVEMSLVTGPAERELLFPRLRLGVAFWNVLPEPARHGLLRQLEWAWRADGRRAALLVRAEGRLDLLRAVVDRLDPDERARLQAVLERLPPEAARTPARQSS